MNIYPLNKFRRLKEFKEFFKITKETIIAYDNNLYTDLEKIYPDVIEHEKTHFKQQNKYGLNNFTKKYLNDKKFRLEMEKEAFLVQLNSIKDEGLKEAVRKDCIEALSSGLYGKISKNEAKKLLGTENKLDVNKLL